MAPALEGLSNVSSQWASKTLHEGDYMAAAKPVYATNADQAAVILGKNLAESETNLMSAYSLKENDTDKIKALAKQLNLTFKDEKDATPRALQLIAEQRYQRSTQMFSLFSNLLDKIDQMKMRVISKFSNS
jgi:hypothetical protein